MNSSSLPSEPKVNRVLPYYAAYVVLGLTLAAFGPTLPNLAAQTGSRLGQVSLIFTANSLGYILGSMLGGRLYDRLPGHPILAAAMLGIAVLIFSIPALSTLWVLVLVVLLLGIALGVLDVGGNTLIVWQFGSQVRPYMNAMHFSFGLGAFLSPLLIDRVVVTSGGINWAYWLLALLAIPIAVWVIRLPSPVPHNEEPKAGETRRGYSRLIALAAGLLFLNVGAELTFGGWIFSYTVALHPGATTTARLLNSAYWGALAVGRLVSIPLATRLQPRNMLLLDILGALASLAVVAVLPEWPPALWIATMGLGLSIASFFPSVLNYIESAMPVTGRTTGIILVGANAGSMIFPWLVGQLFEGIGPHTLMITLGANVLVTLFLLVTTIRYVRSLAGS